MMSLLDDYLQYLDTMKKSSGTIQQYHSSLKMFMAYMKKDKFSITRDSMKKVKLLDIMNFLATIKDTNSGASLRNKISAIKSLFRFCKTFDIINYNITNDIEEQPKKLIRLPKYFNLEECKLLIASVNGRNTMRDRTIIMLFLNTGLRLEELIDLDIDCIEKSDLTIIGKGNKERNICLNSKTIGMLEEYLKERPESELPALFLSEQHKRINKGTVQNAVRNAIKNAGLDKKYDNDMLVHILRHSFATNSYQNGVDIVKLQDILGHADISTTKIYVSASREQMQQQAENSIMSSII